VRACWYVEGAGTKNVAGRGVKSHIITDLSRFRDLDVIASDSSFANRDGANDPRQLARHVVAGRRWFRSWAANVGQGVPVACSAGDRIAG